MLNRLKYSFLRGQNYSHIIWGHC